MRQFCGQKLDSDKLHSLCKLKCDNFAVPSGKITYAIRLEPDMAVYPSEKDKQYMTLLKKVYDESALYGGFLF